MAKKSSESSQSAKPIRNAESIWDKPLNKSQKAVLDRIAVEQARSDDRRIDYSDIPELTGKQLAQFRRVPKKLIAVRLDSDVYEWLQGFGPGYSTRINEVLRRVMQQGL